MSSDEEDVEEVEAAAVEADDVDDASEPAAVVAATTAVGGGYDHEDETSLGDDHTDHTENEDDVTVKSQGTEDAGSETASHKATPMSTDRKDAQAATPATTEGRTRGGRRSSTGVDNSSAKRGRAPSVIGLMIPFRTVKKAMKLDPDIPIVQNEAAIMTTLAVELFLKNLASESFKNANSRGRNTIRYEDVAEARTKDPALAFLETLLP